MFPLIADKEVPREDPSLPSVFDSPPPSSAAAPSAGSSTGPGGRSKVTPISSPRKYQHQQPAGEVAGLTLFWKHIKALEIKRFHHSKRNKKGMLCEILLPAMFVCLAMLFTLILPPLEEQKPLEIHPWMYPYSQDYETTTFFSNSHPAGDWPARYEAELVSRQGMGTKCVKDAEAFP